MKWLMFGNKKVALRGQELLVGRDDSCQVHINEDTTSRKHASLIERGDGYMLIDHTSRNGTFVNGRRGRGSILLTHKDSIRIGATELTFMEWTPTPGSNTRPDHVHDFVFADSTHASASGSAAQTGANLICTVMYRSLLAGDIENARRIVDGLGSRITKSAEAGVLGAAELNGVAPAILEFCSRTGDDVRLTWLLGVYAKRRVFPSPGVASSLRNLAGTLRINPNVVANWLERTRHLAGTAEHGAVIQQMRQLAHELS